MSVVRIYIYIYIYIYAFLDTYMRFGEGNTTMCCNIGIVRGVVRWNDIIVVQDGMSCM